MKRPCIIVKFSDFDDVIKGMWGNILKDFEVEGYSVHNLLLNGYTHTHKHTHTHTQIVKIQQRASKNVAKC